MAQGLLSLSDLFNRRIIRLHIPIIFNAAGLLALARQVFFSNFRILIVFKFKDTVTITAEGFNVEPAQGCLFDYVELQTSTFTERYCGRTSRNFGENRSGQLTTSGSVQILFQSDAGDAYLGFRLRYEISSGESVGCERYFYSDLFFFLFDFQRAVSERGRMSRSWRR